MKTDLSKIAPLSIKTRLLLQSAFVVFAISIFLFIVIRLVLSQAVTATQDGLLTAAANSIINKIYVIDGQVSVDLPYDTFSFLGAIGEDTIFYRLEENGQVITGYNDLLYKGSFGSLQEPELSNQKFNNISLRVVAIENTVFVNNEPRVLRIIIAQSKNFQSTVLSNISNNLVGVTLAFFILTMALSLITSNFAIQPIDKFARDLKLRQPTDLKNITSKVPQELVPLTKSLNGLLDRFRTALRQTETFIAEAAHHIRTPLAVVKSESAIALRKSKNSENRDHLRNIIRSVEQTNRSASQLLDHAMVLYLAERTEKETFSIHQALDNIIKQFLPAAELRDIDISFENLVEKKIKVSLDRTLFDTAFRNLLDNAIKYSIPETKVTVKLKEEKNMMLIMLSNYSTGVQSLNTSQLFKKFKRGPAGKDIIGSGLGLSITREAAYAIGGNIKIKKEKGRVICATLSLPT